MKKTNIGSMAVKIIAITILGAAVTGIILVPIGACYVLDSYVKCMDSMWAYIAIGIPTVIGFVVYGHYKKKKTIHASYDIMKGRQKKANDLKSNSSEQNHTKSK